MNTKTLLIILGVGVVVLVGASLLLLSRPNTDKTPAESIAKPDIAPAVTYDGKSFMPSTLQLQAKKKVTFTNTSGKKIVVNLVGGNSLPYAYLVYVDPGQTIAFNGVKNDGEYTFKEVSNEIANIKNIQESPTKASSSIVNLSPTPIPVPQGTLFVTSDGISPTIIEVKVGNSLIVKNNRTNDVTIKTSGLMNSDITVSAGKTVSTQIFSKSGEFTAWLSNNVNNKVTVAVK